MNRIKTAIVGASGYSGMELLRLLLGHPGVELTAVTSRQEAGKALGVGGRTVHGSAARAEPAAIANARMSTRNNGMEPPIDARQCRGFRFAADASAQLYGPDEFDAMVRVQRVGALFD